MNQNIWDFFAQLTIGQAAALVLLYGGYRFVVNAYRDGREAARLRKAQEYVQAARSSAAAPAAAANPAPIAERPASEAPRPHPARSAVNVMQRGYSA